MDCAASWAQIKDDIDESGIDRQELLSWSIHTLMAAAGQAMQQMYPGAVVACIRKLDHMTVLDITLTHLRARGVEGYEMGGYRHWLRNHLAGSACSKDAALRQSIQALIRPLICS